MQKIPGFSNYLISIDGTEIISLAAQRGRPRRKKLSFSKDRDGYLKVSLTRDDGVEKKLSVHRLVAITYLPNPRPGLFNMINHKNGIKRDNRPENLEWCDNRINQLHSFRVLQTRTGARGQSSHFSKLKDGDIREIRLLSSCGASREDISMIFDISKNHVGGILRREYWSHI